MRKYEYEEMPTEASAFPLHLVVAQPVWLALKVVRTHLIVGSLDLPPRVTGFGAAGADVL